MGKVVSESAKVISRDMLRIRILNDRDFGNEFHFSASRSSGPGGQNVNKVNTKVELRFHIASSSLLSDDEKIMLLEKLANKINSEGELILVAQTERSQLKNKVKVIGKFYTLITRALKPRKKRKPTKPTEASREDRLEKKRRQSQKKALRQSKKSANPSHTGQKIQAI